MWFLYLVSSTEYLALSGRTIYKSLKEADSKAIWYVRIYGNRIVLVSFLISIKQEMMRLVFTFFHVQVDAGLAIYWWWILETSPDESSLDLSTTGKHIQQVFWITVSTVWLCYHKQIPFCILFGWTVPNFKFISLLHWQLVLRHVEEGRRDD